MAYPPDLPDSRSTDLSLSATTIAFEKALPALRVPVPAGSDDDPSKGPYVLVFKDEVCWRRAWRNCEKKIAAQCEAAAMMGCSVTASKACTPSWWKAFIPNSKTRPEDTKACEEKAMEACLAASRQDGSKFAREVCEEVFGDARIAAENQVIEPRFAAETPKCSRGTNVEPSTRSQIHVPGSTNFKGSTLMDRAMDNVTTSSSSFVTKMVGEDWDGDTRVTDSGKFQMFEFITAALEKLKRAVFNKNGNQT